MGGSSSTVQADANERTPLKHNGAKRADNLYPNLEHKSQKIVEKPNLLDRYFSISERGSSIRTEFMAGIANFVANAYLLVLMPKILEQGGVDPRIAITAFVISTTVGSLMVGLTANLPVPVGPGLGCAAFFAYGLTGSSAKPDLNATQMGITCCFLSGMAMMVLSSFDLPRRVFGVVPKSVKDAMPIGLGLLLSLCGFQQMKLVVSDPYTGVRMSTSIGLSVILGTAGAVLMAFLAHKGYDFTKFVAPIGIFTVLSWCFGLSALPKALFSIPAFGETLINFHELGKFFWSPVFGLFMICMFDIGGIVESVCGFADAMDKVKGNDKKPLITPNGVRGEYWVYLSCGMSSILSAYLGATPVIAFGESFAGIDVGGRTGLTSVVSGICFFISLPFEPIFRSVPLYASAPVLVLLGVMLLKLTKGLKLQRMFTAFPSFCTIALMPYLYSIDKAIWAGLISWAALSLLERFSLLFSKPSGEDAITSADLLKQVDSISEKLEKIRGHIMMVNGFDVACAPEINDLLIGASDIVRIAEEQLEATGLAGAGTKTGVKRSMSSIQVMLTPQIKFKQREEGKLGGDSPMLPLEQGNDDLSYRPNTNFTSPYKH
mmetsp:Transcript_16832/g.41403  ORF Transcript_16832/g.41403 Transcript_16832/m.41403 type:complete len:603 (-) Transcript_16832:207-2015(-)|eukprot:CAMPEP_0114506728 /NCGR_PEP_ID=MMETSP0109-20121206/11587_1 /TAXON_ID=29199 /ORGANISM="Chlorarachnion reptans, Strain CCCM449" /LENGTH=602 /DNA_ID=CAMNT_0001685345 /DNA_START=106 /DNA_END=1914 /DNA_ORIENTATION=+